MVKMMVVAMMMIVIIMIIMMVMMMMMTLLSLYSSHVWEKEGSPVNVHSFPRMRLEADGTLHISQTWSGDIGTYTCRVTSVGGNDSRSAYLRVR